LEKKIIIDKLLLNLDKTSNEKIILDQNFWQLFFQQQKILDTETMQCLGILNRAYEGMFQAAKLGDYKDATKQLGKAHYVKNKFEFDENTDAIIKIMTYPNIAYLQYKIKNIRGAKYYTRRTINLIKDKGYDDPILLFRIIQQEINYATLYFKSNDFEKGVNHSIKSINMCYKMINDCVENKNYYDEIYKEDILLLYRLNINELATNLHREVKINKDKLLHSSIIKWKPIERVIKEYYE